MALVASFRSTTRLKWEVQLGQALSEFETGLTIEQKDNFQALRVRTVGSPPTLRDVMQLTAEVDMQARREKRATHQCFGPRFSKFLEVVQQFASIGDVVIGGSQNLIACGVWALVRTTLLVSLVVWEDISLLTRLTSSVGRQPASFLHMSRDCQWSS
jgi:hypothetical protein